MSLLDDIIRDCSDPSAQIADTLRKLKVVASRLDAHVLEEWVDLELSGYVVAGSTVHDELPPYRGPFDTPVRGEFMVPFATESATLPIAPIGFPKEIRSGWLFKVAILEPVSSIQATVSRLNADKLGTVSQPWPADSIAFTNTGMQNGTVHLYANSALFSAHRVVTLGQLVSVVDSVRSRTLELALKLEKLNPLAGELGERVSPTGLNQITNQFFGGTNNIAQGVTATVNVGIPVGDLPALLDALRASGVSDARRTELSSALDEDATELGKPALGRRVQEWIGKTAQDTGLKVGVALITEQIKQYLGL